MGVPAMAENFGYILSPNLFKVFDDTFNRGESMLPALYNMKKSEKSEEKFSAVGGFPSTPEFTGTINYSGVSQQTMLRLHLLNLLMVFRLKESYTRMTSTRL